MEDKPSICKTLFDDFKPDDWASYSKMLDAHARAAWLEGYKAAKNEVLQEIVRNYGGNRCGKTTLCL